MKKLLTAVLVLSMVLGLCFVPSVSAATLKEITLFETDFENDTVGEGAKALKGFSGDSSSEKAGIVEQGTAESGNETKYFDTYGKANQRFRMIFDEAVSSGKFVAEFDLNAGLGSAALGILYSGDLNTYAKWPVFLSNSSMNNEIRGYSEAGAGTPPADIEGKTVTFTKASDGENLTFTANKWQHYRVELDIDNGSVVVYIDGVKSAVMTGYKYFKSSPIGGLAFYMKKTANSTDHTMFDNIKVYKEYGNYYLYKDYEDGEIGTSHVSKGVKITDGYLDFNETQSNVVRYMFDTINSGNADNLYVEFDVRTGYGGMGLTVWDIADKNYGSTNKFVFSEGTGMSAVKYGVGVYKSTNTGHPGISGKTLYTDASGNNMALAVNTWQHVKVNIDLKNKQSSITVDGKASTPVEVAYLDNININGITFKWNLSLSTTTTPWTGFTGNEKDAFIDNLKVYTIADKVYNVGIEDFTPAYTAGTTVTVNYDFTVTDLSSKDVELIVASYNGGELCEVNIEKIENVNASGTKTAALTLTKDCDEIRAFAWENGTLVPLAEHVSKTNNK